MIHFLEGISSEKSNHLDIKLMIFIFLSLVLIMFIPGCISPGPAGLSETGLYLSHNRSLLYQFTGPQFQNFSELNRSSMCDETDECMYFACKNVTSGTLLGIHMPWFETSLLNGNCSLFIVANATKDDNLDDALGDYKVMPIGLGSGSGVSDMNAIGKYNNCSVSMVVKYSYLDEQGYLVPEPDPSITKCLVENQIVPIYVWFLGNWSGIQDTHPDGYLSENDYLSKISNNLGLYGPVIIIPYAGANTSMNESIKSLASDIKNNCDSCMTGVFLDTMLNNTQQEEFLNATIISDVPSSCPMWEVNSAVPWPYNTTCIDFVAWGIDFNHLEDCNGYLASGTAISLGKRILHFYHRPSIILYYGGHEGQSTNNITNCTWHDYDIKTAYKEIYNNLGFLPASGIVYLNAGRAIENESYSINPYVNNMTAILSNDSILGVRTKSINSNDTVFVSASIVLPFLYASHIITGPENIRPMDSMSWNGVGMKCSGGMHFGTLKFTEDDLFTAYNSQLLTYIILNPASNFDCVSCYECGMVGYIYSRISENDDIYDYHTSFSSDLSADDCDIPFKSIAVGDAYEIDPYLMDAIIKTCESGNCVDMPDEERADNAARGLVYLKQKLSNHYYDYLGTNNPSYNQLHAVYDFALVYSAENGYDGFKRLMNSYFQNDDNQCKFLQKFFFKEQCQDEYFSSSKDNVNKAFALYWFYFDNCGWFDEHCG
ncbi:hypothetical protein J7J26_03695 [Candidatus Micrarchaeota archaeon]|nr:hypothetical protein [Candidatus Micrarchaeota archaeon]